MADFNKVYGAGLRNGYIKTADGTVYDINAIISIEGDPQQDDTEIKGDDTLKATFSSGRREEMTITANGLTMDTIAAFTGNTAASSAGGNNIPLGTQSELNPPFVEVGGEVNGRADDGTAVVVTKVWHKVQLRNTKINMAGESELSVEISGLAVQTDKDIEGGSLSPARVATLSTRTGQVA